MSDQRGKRAPYKKGLRANYGDATPEQVAQAMIRSATRVQSESVAAPSNSVRDLMRRIWRSFSLREKRA